MDRYYQNKRFMYYEIQKMDVLGFKPSQIASEMGLDTRTVKKLLAMSEEGYTAFLEDLTHRSKKLAPYEQFVRDRLQDYPLATSAQVKDWLMEYHPELKSLCDKTVYNFVLYVREEHNIPKVFECRDYQMVEELPYGKQTQVDFGEFNMTDTEGHRKKVYFMVMVMARSRYKFVLFQERPYTTEDACVAHDKAFDYIGGYPLEVVYDQDKVFLTKENAGDLILTDAFAIYHRDKPFKLHFCRKSDPQSKGKIENVVRYVKYNFLRGRKFHDIHVLNGQALEWLERTANEKVHSTTHRVPREEWLIERMHLQPIYHLYETKPERPVYHVRKNNTISYKGNYYALPLGTYKDASTQVSVELQDDELIIFDAFEKEILRHKVSLIKGVLVKSTSQYRDTSSKITDRINQVAQYFSNTEKATEYFERIRKEMPRYTRDQLKIIETQCKQHTQADLDTALDYCMENAIIKATDFATALKSLTTVPEIPVLSHAPIATKSRYQIIPQKSNLSDYKPIFK